MTKSKEPIEGTKLLMGALVRMKSKPHEETKLSKPTNKRTNGLKRKAAKNSNKGKGNRPKAGGQAK
jgi:hypothetical protein